VNSNLFVYDEGEHAIYMHTARTGRTTANVGAEERVAFTVFGMGRLLPAPRAFNMSVEYEGVVVFGRARLLDAEAEKERALGLLVDKYFSHLAPVVDYALPSVEELGLTSVYRIAIESWSGKRKAVDAGYEGAFLFGSMMEDGGRTMEGGAERSAAARLSQLGATLPAVPPIAGTYVHCVRTGNLLFTSGHVPFREDGTPILGRLGESLSVEEGQEAARRAALGMLASMRAELGSLDRVARIVRVLATVNATPEFLQHTQVANGASDLLVQVFGEAGKHARLAVGVSSLPFNIALEIEAVVEVREDV
jgi:nitroimidazol reductase NimA-like FMN-containing flavoprotein (pyridoxamine 5'-phosphate oxidase superfamily)